MPGELRARGAQLQLRSVRLTGGGVVAINPEDETTSCERCAMPVSETFAEDHDGLCADCADRQCADCLNDMGEDGESCACYCGECGEWNGDCKCS